MRRIILLITLLAGLVFAGFSLISPSSWSIFFGPGTPQTGILDQVMSNNLLRVAIDANWPPNSFRNANNEMDGFDVDVAREITKRLGVEIKFVTPEWEQVTSGNWDNQWDISVNSMTPTKERAEVLDFPAIYYFTPASFAVPEQSAVTNNAMLNGKIIAANSATTYESYLKQDLNIIVEGTPLVSYEVIPGSIYPAKDTATLFDKIKQGGDIPFDGMLDSLPVLLEAIQNGMPIRLIGPPAFYEPLAIAIKKGDEAFYAKLAKIIDNMHQDGTLADLSIIWFGVDFTKTALELAETPLISN